MSGVIPAFEDGLFRLSGGQKSVFSLTEKMKVA